MPLNTKQIARLRSVGLGLALALGHGALAAAANGVAEVIVSQGLTTAQRAGEPARFVTKGDALAEGEVLNTSSRGYVVLGFKDGARMTLRPGTTFVIEKYAHDAGEESALLRLVKGGLRALTGLIGKRNPSGVSINTATATIGIRGTDFDARLCGAECKQEAAQLAGAPPTTKMPDTPVAARVVRVQGAAAAVNADGQSRNLLPGAPLYSGESVRTARNAHAVLAFRDESKVTLQGDTVFRIDNFRYEAQADKPSSMVLRLIRGGLRAITGLIGKRDPRSVQLQTAVATIGIRGTGVDALCEGRCAEAGEGAAPANAGGAPADNREPGREDGLFVYNWDGLIEVQAGASVLPLRVGEAGVFDLRRGRLARLDQVPQFMRDNPAPRPDQVPVDMRKTFGTVSVPGDEPGLYVTVRDGHVVVGDVDLGRGEAAFLAEGAREAQRLSEVPVILRNDPVPTPSQATEAGAQAPRLLDGRARLAGSELCEM